MPKPDSVNLILTMITVMHDSNKCSGCLLNFSILLGALIRKGRIKEAGAYKNYIECFLCKTKQMLYKCEKMCFYLLF